MQELGDVVKSFLKCRQRMHKSFPSDYERKGKTGSAVRLFGSSSSSSSSSSTSLLRLTLQREASV